VFTFESFQFRMMDVGGQRSERRKWLHCFDRVTAIIFCVALSEYDQVLREDVTNRMVESLTLFGEVFNSLYLKDVTFLLFFNKNDLFEEKIKTVDLAVCFPNYTGGVDNKEAARQFIISRFLEKNLSDRDIFTHVTVAIDTPHIRTIFVDVKEILLKKLVGQVNII